MENTTSRRAWIATTAFSLPAAANALSAPETAAPETAVWETFPMQQSAMVKEMVTVSHGNMKRVRELVEAHPSLAKASWDWGFGDWEAAIDAASHVGNREIAEYLIAKGARPTLFTAAMLGHLDVVKALIMAQPGIQANPGPHGISLLAHAKNGGAPAKEVYGYLESLGDAGSPTSSPISDQDLETLKGNYSFGSGASDRIEIGGPAGQLSFMRAGGIARGLIHAGAFTFHPAGADAVRVRFQRTPDSMTLTVHDPELILTAVKLK